MVLTDLIPTQYGCTKVAQDATTNGLEKRICGKDLDDVGQTEAGTNISTTKARSRGYRAPANDNKVSVAPNKMKNKGFINPPSKKDIQGGI